MNDVKWKNEENELQKIRKEGENVREIEDKCEWKKMKERRNNREKKIRKNEL